MGPQELGLVLAGHESVRPPAHGSCCADQGHSQPIMADEVQTFKALITVHKVLQEGHPVVLKEAQANAQWLDSLQRATGGGDGLKGYGRLISEYVYYLRAKLSFHRQHPEFNGELVAHADRHRWG